MGNTRMAGWVVCLITLIGCGTTVGITTHDSLTHDQKMDRGKRQYEKKCASCHPLKNPALFTGPQATAAIAKFGKKAGLTRAERQLVEYYLLEVGLKPKPLVGPGT